MATLLPRPPHQNTLHPPSQRPPLYRGHSCPSPRPPPAQYIAPSTPKRPVYLEDESWGDLQAHDAFADNAMNLYTQSVAFGVGLNAMASAMEAYNTSWAADGGISNSNLAFDWNNVSRPSVAVVAPLQGIETMWSGDVALSQFSSPYGAHDPNFPYSNSDNTAQSLSYAVTAISASSLVVASAAAVLSEQHIISEDAKMNTAGFQVNQIQHDSQPDYLQSDPSYSAPNDPGLPVHNSISSSSLHSRPPLTSHPSKNKKPKTNSKERTWSVQSQTVQHSDGKVVAYRQTWVPNIKIQKPRTKEERDRTALNRLYKACPQHKETHKGV